MTAEEQIALVEAYFAAVDGENLPGVLATLTKDCVFSVETHGIHLHGHDEISGMFRRLWADHRAVRHHAFVHVPDPVSYTHLTLPTTLCMCSSRWSADD